VQDIIHQPTVNYTNKCVVRLVFRLLPYYFLKTIFNNKFKSNIVKMRTGCQSSLYNFEAI